MCSVTGGPAQLVPQGGGALRQELQAALGPARRRRRGIARRHVDVLGVSSNMAVWPWPVYTLPYAWPSRKAGSVQVWCCEQLNATHIIPKSVVRLRRPPLPARVPPSYCATAVAASLQNPQALFGLRLATCDLVSPAASYCYSCYCVSWARAIKNAGTGTLFLTVFRLYDSARAGARARDIKRVDACPEQDMGRDPLGAAAQRSR